MDGLILEGGVAGTLERVSEQPMAPKPRPISPTLLFTIIPRQVRICRDRHTGCLVAVKKLRKAEMVKRGQVHHVRAERNVLAEVRHKSVVRLLCSFQDEETLYLVMEYMPGGDLMTLLIRQEILPEAMARFYLAQVWVWACMRGGTISICVSLQGSMRFIVIVCLGDALRRLG